MKKIFQLIALLTFTSAIFAQQDAQYSHYMFNNSAINPAYAGMNGEICINMVSHQQWRKFEGAPTSTLLTVDSPVNLFGKKWGAGLKMLDDRLGFVQNFTATGLVAFHQNIGLGTLGIGFEAGIFNKLFEPEWKFPDQNEPILPTGSQKLVFDMGGGLFYKIENLFLGLSSSHFIRPKFKFEADDAQTLASEIILTNHYYFTGGYNIQMANSLIDLTPSFLIKSDGASIQADLNLMLLYNKKFWFGVTYRNEDAVVFLAGTSIFNNFKIGLSYDAPISAVRTVSTGTFEAYVGYCFWIWGGKPPQMYHNVKTL